MLLNALNILDINLSDVHIQLYSPNLYLMDSFLCIKEAFLVWYNLTAHLLFYSLTIWGHIQNISPADAMWFSSSFVVFCLTLYPLNSVWVDFCWYEQRVQFHVSAWGCPCLLLSFAGDCSLSIVYLWYLCWNQLTVCLFLAQSTFFIATNMLCFSSESSHEFFLWGKPLWLTHLLHFPLSFPTILTS